jgi:hypothetical protein
MTNKNRSREGGAMIVVMLILLTSTALAVFAVHATTFEMQASGHARQGMQSQYVAETGLNAGLAMIDRMGPQALLYSMERNQQESSRSGRELEPYEPDLAADKTGYRMYLQDLTSFGTGAPVDMESIGTRQAYEPTFMIDINDHYTYVGALEGNRSDGYGRLQFLHATYTARGRMQLSAGDTTSTAGAIEDRQYHEAATDGRAHGVSGPFGR